MESRDDYLKRICTGGLPGLRLSDHVIQQTPCLDLVTRGTRRTLRQRVDRAGPEVAQRLHGCRKLKMDMGLDFALAAFGTGWRLWRAGRRWDRLYHRNVPKMVAWSQIVSAQGRVRPVASAPAFAPHGWIRVPAASRAIPCADAAIRRSRRLREAQGSVGSLRCPARTFAPSGGVRFAPPPAAAPAGVVPRSCHLESAENDHETGSRAAHQP
jgi:hypothetical protein